MAGRIGRNMMNGFCRALGGIALALLAPISCSTALPARCTAFLRPRAERLTVVDVYRVVPRKDTLSRCARRWRCPHYAGGLNRSITDGSSVNGDRKLKEGTPRLARDRPVAALPLMEIMRIGDSDPEPLPTGDRPLSGIRVLDLTRVLAGPTCARTLAEHGADVLEITGAHLPSLGYQELDTGHGKLAAHLDLRAPGDVDILRGLVRKADVFSQGYRPGTLASRGLSPEELAAIRPGLVYVSLSAFGHAGPWASRRGFDTVVQTVSGITIRQAEFVPGDFFGAAFLPSLGDRLLHGLLDGIWRDGGISAPDLGRWQLAGTNFSRSGRQMDRRSR